MPYSPATQPITLTAAVTDNSGTVSVGSVVFTITNGTTTVATTLPINVGGGMASTTFTLPAGTHAGSYTISATYSGAPGLGGSTDTTHLLTITRIAPVVTWASPTAVASGTVLGATQLNAHANIPGTFAYTPAAGTVLAAGLGQTLSATFTPTDAVDYTSATTSTTLNVVAASVTTLTVSPATTRVLYRQPVILTAVVTAIGGPVATGTITFLNGTQVLGSPVALDATGHASLTTSSLPLGTRSITAQYSGAVPPRWPVFPRQF